MTLLTLLLPVARTHCRCGPCGLLASSVGVSAPCDPTGAGASWVLPQ
eukprot:CAMPEP_0202875854 /NCGR_PEP_ID=MMETSP1391-20130828/28056_1 /ASSEMBLY_ACC=CAM_ASM_000867 /TAXON_ID=1034604 /ORGANISM="Chlamydomonas leiostraca, Strain SAG 11-49" /LENGTH=46 /DNA_ID= /DNA_START= /DNA_END= /DNA_ORIENTATION=